MAADTVCVLPNNFHLSDDFSTYSKRRKKVKAYLNLAELRLDYMADNLSVDKSELYPRGDIIGCHVMKTRPVFVALWPENDEDEAADAFLCIYVYALHKRKLLGGLRRERSTVVLRVECPCALSYRDRIQVGFKWRRSIYRVLRQGTAFERLPAHRIDPRILVIVNPKSGQGRALRMFRERVVPILAEASFDFNLLVTQTATHAREMLGKQSLENWDAILVVSGDGLLYEVVNALMCRPDWKDAISKPLGIVPGGSGNGLASALGYILHEPFDENPVLVSALSFIKGNPLKMDLVCVQTKSVSTPKLYSFLSIGWGLMADVDIESERLRAIGSSRFTLWTLAKIFQMRTYQGRLSYLPALQDENDTETIPTSLRNERLSHSVTVEGSSHGFNSDGKAKLGHSSSWTDGMSPEIGEMGMELVQEQYEQKIVKSTTLNGKENSANRVAPSLRYPSLPEPVPSDWVVEEGEFLMVYAAYQTHLSPDVLFAPRARMDDGVIWLLIMRSGLSRSQVASFMMQLSSGEHISYQHNSIKMLRVTAFRLEPDLTQKGHLTVDGELIEYGPIQAEVMPSVATMLAR